MLELVPKIENLWNNKQDSLVNSANDITEQLINRNLFQNNKTDISTSPFSAPRIAPINLSTSVSISNKGT